MNKQFVPEKVQDRLFNAILKRPDNQECADCSAKGPRWVSLDFGVFICMNCAGAHRTLGPSVSRVRSTKLDGWFQENIDIMENIGNGPANSYWENQLPKGSLKPAINASLEQLIRFVQEKYVKKLYIPSQAQDPKAYYLANNKQLKPYYFDEHSTSDTQQSQDQQKPQLGDLIEMDEDEFQEYKQTPCQAKQYSLQEKSEVKSNMADVGPQSSNSLSPTLQDKQKMASHQQGQTVSFPSLDILNLYNQNLVQSSQTSQQSLPNTNKNKYAYLQQMGHQQGQPQHQQVYYQQQQFQSNNNQINLAFHQAQNIIPQNTQPKQSPSGQVDIMQLYGQQKIYQHPHSYNK